MATYKVLQDIEAEDKLLGPLTLRQFIYAGIAAINGYLTFFVVSKGAAFMAIVFFPITLVCIFFAWPWSRDQPTEVWALAKIRFMVKPRKRIWNQTGIKELVTVTVPKTIERSLTNGLSENEVRSRLRALSDTIDSRGWAVKNVNVNMYTQPAYAMADFSDRLVSSQTLPQPVPTIDIKAADDILDEKNNPVAQQFDTMIAASAKAHRQNVINKMQQTATPIAPPPKPQPLQQKSASDYWFLNQPSQTSTSVPQDSVTFNTQVVAPGTSVSDLPVTSATPTADEEAFMEHLKAEPTFSPNIGHLHVIQPLSQQKAAPATAAQVQQPNGQPVQSVQPQNGQTVVQNQPAPKVTQKPDAGILDFADLARNNDLNVATIAREAQKRSEPPQDEVVISLH